MAKQGRKVIDLALQGGGAHGAITWGVLDRLLEDERVEISGISGTSAGALNAAVLAHGLHAGGRDGAKTALQTFWHSVSRIGQLSPIQRSWWDRFTGSYSMDTSPSYLWFAGLTQLFSPKQLNPLGLNPLRSLLVEQVDFDRVNAPDAVRVYVTATNVRTGRARVFYQPELTADTLMASACLPTVYETVEIDGEPYWDGGYSGNPALYPLVEDTTCRDLLVVQVNPLERRETPRSAREILDRVNEITFNSSLIKDLRSLHLLHQLIENEGLESERYRAMFVHVIHADVETRGLRASSKLNTERAYLELLRQRGWDWADAWVEENFEALGQRSSFDLDSLFEDAMRPPKCARKAGAPRSESSG